MNPQTQTQPRSTASPYGERICIKQFEDKQVPGTGIEIQGFANKPSSWSIKFYTVLRDGRPASFMRPGLDTEDNKVSIDMCGMRYARLIDEANLYIQDEAQRAPRSSGRPGQKLSPLGANLTPEQREAKKKRHEANQAARRAADAEFRNKARGK